MSLFFKLTNGRQAKGFISCCYVCSFYEVKVNYLLISTPLTAKTALNALSVRQTPYPNRTTVANRTTNVHLRVPYSTLVTTHCYHYDLSSDSAVQSMHDPFTAQLFRPTLLDIRHFRSVRCHPRIYGHCCASVGALSEQRVSLLSLVSRWIPLASGITVD